MKHLIILLALFGLTSCKQHEPKYVGCVEQEFSISYVDERAPKLFTYVWYRDKVVESWGDEVGNITDSLAQARRDEGLALLKIIKEINVKPITLNKHGK